MYDIGDENHDEAMLESSFNVNSTSNSNTASSHASIQGPRFNMSFRNVASLSDACEQFGLSDQLTRCIQACGYESVTTVASIESPYILEDFLRDSFEIFSVEEVAGIYGRYFQNPGCFRFLPGQAAELNCFILHCQGLLQRNATTTTTANRNGTHLSKRMARVARMSQQRSRHCLNSNSAPSLKGKGQYASSSSLDTDILAVSSDDAVEETASTSLDNSTARAGGVVSIVTTPNLATSTFKQPNVEKYSSALCKQIQRWCLSHTAEKVRMLRSEVDYKVVVSPELRQAVAGHNGDGSHAIWHLIKAHVRCLRCSARISVQIQGFRRFCISNVTRHFTKCTKRGEQKTHEQQSNILVDIGEFGGVAFSEQFACNSSQDMTEVVDEGVDANRATETAYETIKTECG